MTRFKKMLPLLLLLTYLVWLQGQIAEHVVAVHNSRNTNSVSR